MKPNRILHGDIRTVFNELPDQSVNCIVTSPPYWGLRDYGTARWVGGDAACDHRPKRKNGTSTSTLGGTRKAGNHTYEGFISITCPKCGAVRVDDQIGLEPTPGEHVAVLVNVFRELRRVLRDDGTLWLNYGDCYATSANGRSAADTKTAGNDDRTFRDKPFSTVVEDLKPKDLVGMPWRLALALQADGWYLRSDIIWHKPNPMPESVTDRPTKAHEYIFLLTKSERYYYDAAAIAEPVTVGYNGSTFTKGKTFMAANALGAVGQRQRVEKDTRNKRTVWTVPTSPYAEAHFATFPPALVEPCILAGCPPGGIVLDPFFGAGTVGVVCTQTGRNWLGIELNPDYIKLAERRISGTQPALIAPAGKEQSDGNQ